MKEPDNLPEPAHPRIRFILLLIFGSVILAAMSPFVAMNAPKSMQILLGELCLLMPAVLYVRSKGYDSRSVFRLRPISRPMLTASILLGLGLPALNDELDRLIGKIIEMPAADESLLAGLLRAQSSLDWIILIAGVIVIAGFAEEMLFRGLLQQALERRSDFLQAILLSSLIFAMIHPYPWFLQIILIGSVLGYLAWRADSILPSVVVHACNNTFALCSVNFDVEDLQWYNWYGHVHPTVIAISACACFYAIRWFHQLTSSSDE